jgi:hypothetical protein
MKDKNDHGDFAIYVVDDEGAWGPITKYSPPERLACLNDGRTSSEDCQIVEFTTCDDAGAMKVTDA